VWPESVYIIVNELGESTFYAGKRSSQRLLRVYDRTKITGGDDWGMRWELQLSRAAAETALQHARVSDNWLHVWLCQLRALVDFKEDPNDSNSTRRPRVREYERFIRMIARVSDDIDADLSMQ
jgi:hypothetical protein